MKTRVTLAALLGCLLVACSQTTAGEEQTDNVCPASPMRLTGTVPEGGDCTVYTECAPVCCTCPGGGGMYLASECTDAKCADMASACAEENSITVCPLSN